MNIFDREELLDEIVRLCIQIGELKYEVGDLQWKLSLVTTNCTCGHQMPIIDTTTTSQTYLLNLSENRSYGG